MGNLVFYHVQMLPLPGLIISPDLTGGLRLDVQFSEIKNEEQENQSSLMSNEGSLEGQKHGKFTKKTGSAVTKVMKKTPDKSSRYTCLPF